MKPRPAYFVSLLLGSMLLAGFAELKGAVANAASRPVIVGSKKFTESVVLGEIAVGLLREENLPVQHRAELGGTRILYDALLRGDIDAYPEYTGTIREELLRKEDPATEEAMVQALAAHGLRMSGPLGFNDTYALGMRRDTAERFGISTISDLRNHPDLRYGLTNEFLDRGDGWPGLRQAYGLNPGNVRGLDHDLAYRALNEGSIDLTDLYTTDAEIEHYGFVVLKDDRAYFPRYDAVFLYRADLDQRAPAAVKALDRLAGTVDEPTMRALNARARIERIPEGEVAARFLHDKLGIAGNYERETMLRALARRTLEHLYLVGASLLAGILVAIPLGVIAFKRPRAGHIVLGAVGMVQTIPALALLVFMIPLLGIASRPALAALFLYSLLPIVRSTHAGLRQIPPALAESAEALGVRSDQRLWRIELPLASRSILAGIKTAAVITVGFATLGALIGAGGYGQPILTGIRLDDYRLILEGAVPAALLALLVQFMFDGLERAIVPRGLRIESRP